MKYLLSVFLILISVQAYGFSTAIQAVLSVNAAVPTGLCTSSTACGAEQCEELCEDWEDTDYKWATWTENLAAGSTVTYNAAHPGTLSCTNKGSYAIRFQYGTAGSDSYISAPLAVGNLTTNRGQAYIYINAEGLGDGEKVMLFSTKGSEFDQWMVELKQNFSSELIFRFSIFASGYYTASEDSTTVLSTGTWYRLRWDVVADAASATFYIDGNSTIVSDTPRNNADTLADTMIIGPVTNKDGTVDFYIDLIQVDNDTIPGACP